MRGTVCCQRRKRPSPTCARLPSRRRPHQSSALSRTARSALQPQPARLRPGEGLDEDEAVAARGSEDLVQKIGLHEGPCLAANARQNDFGPTVNIASHMQGPAERR